MGRVLLYLCPVQRAPSPPSSVRSVLSTFILPTSLILLSRFLSIPPDPSFSACFSLPLGTRSSPPGASNCCCQPPRYSIALKHPLLVIFNPYSKRRRPPNTCQKPQFQSFYFFCFLTCPKAYFILRSMPHPVLLASP